MKILFMGTPDFAKESLEAIYESGHEIVGVVTNPDKPKGRGMKMIASPVKEFATEKGIPVFQPIKVRKNEEFIFEIKKMNPDVICVVAYGKILPKEILEIPKLGCINVHGSLLPQYRGAAPIQWAVLNGDTVTGITTMYMNEGMDTGDMILKEQVMIGDDETTGELWDRLSKLGGQLLVKTLKQIELGTAPRIKQGEEYTIAPMLDKKIAQIDWKNQTARQIKNLVRGLNPMMGSYSFYEGKKIKFWRVQVLTILEFDKQYEFSQGEIEKKENGTILLADAKQGLFVKAQDGIIQVLEIQGENARRMDIDEFLRGNKLEKNHKFE